jgi:hypothetical protein
LPYSATVKNFRLRKYASKSIYRLTRRDGVGLQSRWNTVESFVLGVMLMIAGL